MGEHICGSPYNDEHCEFLHYSGKDETLNGKKLDSFCLYCLSENKIRKISGMSSWTGLTPKFCPKLKEKELTVMSTKFDMSAMLAPPPAVVNEQYAEAARLNAEIINCARVAQQSIYQMAEGFKKMRDEKLYTALGYKNFGDYCESETSFFGMGQRSAERYIKVIEDLPPEVAKMQIGITKLHLLTTVSEEDRAEIIENTDLEKSSANDIKSKIKEIKDRHKAEMAAKDKELKKEIDKNTELTDKLNKAAEQRNEEKKQLQEKIAGLESEIKDMKSNPAAGDSEENERLKDKIAELEGQVKELENRPVDVAVQRDDEEINRLREEVGRLKAELDAEADTTEMEFNVMFKSAYEQVRRTVLFAISSKNTELLKRIDEFEELLEAARSETDKA